MKILLNINDQISAEMIENHFRASSIDASVAITSKEMMLELVRVCKIDMIAYYADQVDSAGLLKFFSEIRAAAPGILLSMFVKKENLSTVSETLQFYLDECFTVPLDSIEFILRLKRMMRANGQRNINPSIPPQQKQTVQPVSQPDTNPLPPATAIYNQPEAPLQQQTVQAPPVVIKTSPAVPVYTKQANADSYIPESFQTNNRAMPAVSYPKVIQLPAEPYVTQAKVETANEIRETVNEKPANTNTNENEESLSGKEKAKKIKSPLRHLNKTELLEIILEQEKKLVSMNNNLEELKKQIENREIIMEDSGSIAEAALRLNGIFEAAQKAADQYLESVKVINIRSIKLTKNEDRIEMNARDLG